MFRPSNRKLIVALAAAGLVLAAGPAHAGSYVFYASVPGLRPTPTPVTADAVSSASLTFGSVMVGASSAPQSVILTNTGNMPVTVSQVLTTGNYSASQNCGSSLAAGSACTVSVVFTPEVMNTNSGQLSILTNAGTQTVALTGTGLEGLLTLSPTSLAFGSVAVGKSSASQSFTITNAGNTTVTSLSLASSSSYTQTSTCTSSLAAGASCTSTVTFSPSTAAAVNGSVTVSSSAATVTEALSGTGATPTFTLSPASMAFGAVPVNTASSAQTYTLRNTGTVPLTIGATTLPSGASLTSDTCSNTTLAAGASCTGSVRVTPTTTTAYSGTVSIATNGSSANTIALSAYGAESDALLSPVYTVTTGEQNSAWDSTGYGWVWNVSGYSSSAAAGDLHFETLITNSTGTAESIYVNVAVDNDIDGFKISGVSQSLGCLAYDGFASVCTMGPYTIPPGTTRIDLSANNAGSTANPAGMSAWVSTSSGAVLSSTSNTSQFYWTTAGF